MSRHWRCANAHDWVGDLGALTFCPECGSADVYEIRDSRPADQPTAVPPAPPAGDVEASTLILPPSAHADQTWIQPPTDSPAPSDPSDETHMQLSAAPARTPVAEVIHDSEPPQAANAVIPHLDPANDSDLLHDQITRELRVAPLPDPAANGTAAAPPEPSADTAEPAVNGQVPSDSGRTDTWIALPSTPATSIVELPAEEPRDSQPSIPAAADDTESVHGASTPRPVPPRSAPRIAGYDILGVLGRGGMGVVYKARQKGLNRLVALKMVLGGIYADRAGQGRFRAEGQAIAELQHPNIVQVYDVGEHDDLPYFSLEYLDGGSLQQRLAGKPQTPRAAAALIEQLARAVQYAHERGIVHRDLKPGNILFAGVRSQETGVRSQKSEAGDQGPPSLTPDSCLLTPKITDFGLARRMGTDSSLTGTGVVLGTPSYMSPEQAEGRPGAIGPPTDIHALGAILYEMLTGRPPFLGADPTATVMQVRLMEPVPPRRWQPAVPRDLETITLKCLQKEPHKRYATAGALADDLRRFLSGSPIQARPVSLWEKAWKWTRRHPAAAGLVALSAAVVVGLIVGGLAFARHEHQLRTLADQARGRAEQNFFSAREAMDMLLTRVGAERVGNEPPERLRSRLLDDALVFYGRFLRESDDPAERREAGWAYQRVGQIRKLLGQGPAAIAAYQKAVELFTRLMSEAPNDPRPSSDLAEIHRLLAIALEAEGRRAEADRSHAAARELLVRLADDHPQQPEYRLRLGELLSNRGDQFAYRHQPAEAERHFRAALEELDRLCAEFVDVVYRLQRARVQSSLGALLLTQNQTEPALALLRAAAEARIAVLVRDPADRFEHVKELGRVFDNLGTALLRSGQTQAAEAAFRAAEAQFANLAKDAPKVPEYRFAQALALDNLAHSRKTAGGLLAAEPERSRALALWKELAEEHPDADYQFRYALSLDEHGIYLEEVARRRADAIKVVGQALGLLQKLAAANPLDLDLARELARRHLNLGILLARDRQQADAEGHYARAYSILEDVLARGPAVDAIRLDLITAHTNRAALMHHLGRPRDEEWSWRRVAELQEQRIDAFPASADLAADLARTQFTLAGLRGDQPEQALPALADAVRRQRAALALASVAQRSGLSADLAKYGTALLEAQVDQGEHAAAAGTVSQLETDLSPTWDGWPRIAGLLCRCMRLARDDTALADEARAQAVRGYGEKALGLLRRAVVAGRLDAATLRSADVWALLRNGSEFREAFAQLIADAEARSKGDGD